MQLHPDMLRRWKQLVKDLEFQATYLEETERTNQLTPRVDWSDISVLDAYLSDDWDEDLRGPNPDKEDLFQQMFDQPPAMQTSYAKQVLDHLVELRRAFFYAVPDSFADRRFAEMMGSPLSVIYHVTQYFEAVIKNPQEPQP